MPAISTVLVSLAEQVPEPEDVKAGWVALVLFLVLAVAVVILGFSLVKHLRRARANFAEMDAEERGEDGDDAGATGNRADR